jgi:FK506-binding nuclear protein
MSVFFGAKLVSGKPESPEIPADSQLVIRQAAVQVEKGKAADASLWVKNEDKEHLIACLSAASPYTAIDLRFSVADEGFELLAKGGHIHVSGYYVPLPDYDASDSEDEEMMFGGSDSEDEEEDEEGSNKAKLEVLDDEEEAEGKQSKKRKNDGKLKEAMLSEITKQLLTKPTPSSDDSEDAEFSEEGSEDDDDEEEDSDDDEEEEDSDDDEEEDSEDEEEDSDEEEDDSEEEEAPQPPAKKSKAAAEAAKPQQKQKEKEKEQPKKDDAKGKVRTIAGGIQVTELAEGSGKSPKPGQRVHVLYTGKLKNGKVFDSCTNSNKPFSFRLGVGEVIKGWDLGVAGMKVGGKRRLVIPAAMGYGKQGAPPQIPPHSTLYFDVTLVRL